MGDSKPTGGNKPRGRPPKPLPKIDAMPKQVARAIFRREAARSVNPRDEDSAPKAACREVTRKRISYRELVA